MYPSFGIVLSLGFLSAVVASSDPHFQKYTISAPGINATFLPYGATLTSLSVNDKNGDPQDVVLGYDNAEDYLKDTETVHDDYGKIVGRYANRIKNGTFTINGVTSHIPEYDNMGHDTLYTGEILETGLSWRITHQRSLSRCSMRALRVSLAISFVMSHIPFPPSLQVPVGLIGLFLSPSTRLPLWPSGTLTGISMPS